MNPISFVPSPDRANPEGKSGTISESTFLLARFRRNTRLPVAQAMKRLCPSLAGTIAMGERYGAVDTTVFSQDLAQPTSMATITISPKKYILSLFIGRTRRHVSNPHSVMILLVSENHHGAPTARKNPCAPIAELV